MFRECHKLLFFLFLRLTKHEKHIRFRKYGKYWPQEICINFWYYCYFRTLRTQCWFLSLFQIELNYVMCKRELLMQMHLGIRIKLQGNDIKSIGFWNKKLIFCYFVWHITWKIEWYKSRQTCLQDIKGYFYWNRWGFFLQVWTTSMSLNPISMKNSSQLHVIHLYDMTNPTNNLVSVFF